MTDSVAAQIPVTEHVGNGVTTSFAYTFTILDSADMVVEIDGVAQGSGFTVSGVGVLAGGAVLFTSAPASGVSVLLRRSTDLSRSTSYTYAGDLRETVVDEDFNRLWHAMQERAEVEDRALRAPVGETVSVLPAAAARASKLLGFDASGSPQLYSPDPELVALWANVLAPGDGVVDDTTRVQTALNAGPGVVTLSPGAYKFNSGLTVPAGVELVMDGATLDFSDMPAGTSLGQQVAISAAGSVGSPVTASDIALGASTVIVSSVAGLLAEDWVIIQSDQLYSDGAAPGLNTRGHYAQIASVDSGTSTITLRTKSPFAYAAASNARVSKMDLLQGVRIRGGTIILGGVGSVHTGIKVIYAQRPEVSGVTVIGGEDAGVVAAGCISPAIVRCDVRESTSPGGVIGNTGYGVAVYGGSGGSVSNCSMVHCRHGVAGGGYGGAVSSAVVVEGNTLLGCGINTWALDCHEPCFQWLFTGNTVDGGNGGAILRGPGTVFDGNVIRNVATSAVRVQQFEDNVDGLLDVIVSNNGIANPGGGGVWVTGHTVTTDKVTAVIVTDNNIVGAGDHSIHGSYCVGLQVRGGSVREQGGSGRFGVYLSNCTGAVVTGGRYDLSATANGTCVYIENSIGVRVSDATLLGAAGATNQDGVRITGTTGASVRGVVASGMSRHGVYASTSDRVIIAHNDVRDAGSVRKVLVEGATTVCVSDNIGEGSSLMRGGVMPEAFGADPSGVSDSSSAIQAAINAAASSGLELDWGSGNYSIASEIVLTLTGPMLWVSSGAKVTHAAAAATQTVFNLKLVTGLNYIRGGFTLDVNQKAFQGFRFEPVVQDTYEPDLLLEDTTVLNWYRSSTAFSGGDAIYWVGTFGRVHLIRPKCKGGLMAAGAGISGSEGIFGITGMRTTSSGSNQCAKYIKIEDPWVENIWSEDAAYVVDQDAIRMFTRYGGGATSGKNNPHTVELTGGRVINVRGRSVKFQTESGRISGLKLYRTTLANAGVAGKRTASADIDVQTGGCVISDIEFNYDEYSHYCFIRSVQAEEAVPYGLPHAISNIVASVAGAYAPTYGFLFEANSGTGLTQTFTTVLSNVNINNETAITYGIYSTAAGSSTNNVLLASNLQMKLGSALLRYVSAGHTADARIVNAYQNGSSVPLLSGGAAGLTATGLNIVNLT